MKENFSLVILVGLPFSGKTFLGKKLEEKLGYTRIAFDEVWQSLESDKTTNFELSFESVTEYIKKLIQSKLSAGESVIYDSLNDTPDQRTMWRNLANEAGAKSLIVFLETPLREIKARRQDNRVAKDRHTVDDTLFNNAIKKFIDPSEEEGVLVFKQTEDFDKWFSKKF